MKIEQIKYDQKEWTIVRGNEEIIHPQLVLYFGSSQVLESDAAYSNLKNKYPKAHIVGCTTAGEIIDKHVFDDSVVASAIEFDDTTVSVATTTLENSGDSFASGQRLASELNRTDLRGVMVISDGTQVNGSELVRGIVNVIGDKIPVTGGLAGDGARFEVTRVGCDGTPLPGQIAAIGFYGDRIRIGHGSVGGWESFGPERRITRSDGNILYELDGQPALDLYKTYLGEEAANLPGSSLLFPLMVSAKDNSQVGLVRTILAIDESNQSITFAGDIPEGYYAKLMRANFEKLIDGAGEAANYADITEGDSNKLAVLISCIGRKMVLGQRTVEEVQAVHHILGANTYQLGFYSYGEISPHVTLGSCELHNQTMTVTTLSEN